MAMATNLTVFNIRASASSSEKSESSRRKAISPNWWSPIFGWSSEPDYVTNKSAMNLDLEIDNGGTKSRFAPGSFTEEKAKLLRVKTLESSAFHDVMYHSAIASRLASDLSDRSKK